MMPALTATARHSRVLIAALCVAALALAARPWSRDAYAAAPQTQAEHPAQTAHESGTAEGEAAGGWSATMAKAVNFIALVALLAYFLKAPIVGYLRTRGETIRKDLTEAAALRASAHEQLAGVQARLNTLPAELDALTRRGQEDLAAERVRLAEATAREKERVLQQTRREIEMQFRVARRQLLEHAADLSMTLARERIARNITPDDQARMVDRYAAEVQA